MIGVALTVTLMLTTLHYTLVLPPTLAITLPLVLASILAPTLISLMARIVRTTWQRRRANRKKGKRKHDETQVDTSDSKIEKGIWKKHRFEGIKDTLKSDLDIN